MPRRSHLAFSLALAAVLAAGCRHDRGAQPGTAEPAGRLPAAAWTAASDPAAVAAWARAGCDGVALSQRRECYERALLPLIEPLGVAKTMAVLDSVAARDPWVRREGHALAHGIGIAAYRSPQTVGATFAACGPTQMSGCYHGVIQGYFLDVQRRTGAVGDEALNAVCQGQKATRFLFFQCAHGLGHGLMALRGHHLPTALADCDRLRDGFERESCYGGAFMENIVNATNPHHTAAAHASLLQPADSAAKPGGHAHGPAAADTGHAHGPAAADTGHAHAHGGHAPAAAEPFPALKSDDPLYPCSVVDQKYHTACYYIQTAAMLWMNKGSVEAAARACEQAPARMVRVCFMSLGRDITALAAQSHPRALELCARAGARGERWCVEGVAENLVNVSADAGEGLRFCALVAGEGSKGPCYLSVGDMLADIDPDSARRERVCAGAEAAFVQTCRRGARLPPAPAPAADSAAAPR